jgi:hypothetical protein
MALSHRRAAVPGGVRHALPAEGWNSEHRFRSGGTRFARAQGAPKLGTGPLIQLKDWKKQAEIEVVAVLAMTAGPR